MKKLCQDLLYAKAAESAAKSIRLDAESALIEALNPTKLEGTETKAIDGFKISVTTKLTRSLDYEAYKSLQLPENLSFVDMKPAINLKNLRMIERIDPGLSAKCVTSKLGKTSIKIEEV